MKYYRKKRNPKVIALFIELALSLIGFIVLFIYYKNGIQLNIAATLIITGILLFSIVLTLSKIRFDAMRDIRSDGSFKQSNLPLFTDETTLIGHDIKEENNSEHK